MNTFLTHYRSSINTGYSLALGRLLEGTRHINTEDPQQPLTFTSVSTAAEYNEALQQLYLGLHGLFSEVWNINALDDKIERLCKEEIARLRSSIEDLELRVLNTASLASFSQASYTDSILETFNTQTLCEESNRYFQGGTIPRALIDTSDGKLKLPVNGEFVNVLTETGEVPSNVFLDRVYGSLVGEGNEAYRAFDRSISSFWCEVIHTSSPAYTDRLSTPWLPRTYTGGAACRIRIDFEHKTQISELDIRPYGPYPPKILGIGYTSEELNYLPDPNFVEWWGDSGSIWTLSTTSYGASGGATAERLAGAGPEAQNVIHVYTYTASGAGHILHDPFRISSDTGIEISALIKTLGDTASEICMTFYTSGTSGGVGFLVPLKDTIETVRLDGLGWTRVVVTFDVPPLTTHAKVRFGIPPVFDRIAHLYICDPRVEPITTLPLDQQLNGRSTILLSRPIVAKRAYLTFSQEHYDFKHYLLNREQAGLSWDRLLRRRYMDPTILSWDRSIRRQETTGIPQVPTTQVFHSSEVMRPISGVYQLLLDDLEKLAAGTQVEISGYEYIIGAFEIYLRHREYSSQGRFVSKPIRVGGEIREIILKAIDTEPAPDSIEYRVTLHEDNPPEVGKIILNQNRVTQDTLGYPTPPATLDYMPTTNNPWVGATDRFINLPSLGSRQYILDAYGLYANNSAFFGFLPGALAESHVQFKLPASVDLRGATDLTMDIWYGQTYYTPVFTALAPLCLRVELLDSNQTTIISESLSELNVNENAPFYYFAYPPVQQSISLTNVPPESRGDITYIRLVLVHPLDEGYVYNETNRYDIVALIGIKNLRISGRGGGSSMIRFIPADETSLLVYATSNDFVVPSQHIREVIKGTDRYGRAALREYPYLNKSLVTDLISTLSANTGGRTVPYDPNALEPRYLSGATTVATTPGYRPIAVTLRLINEGVIARPDVLGKPDPGDIGYISGEVLELADVTQTAIVALEKVTSGSTGTQKVESQTTQERTVKTYETAMRPLVSDVAGVPIRCWWKRYDTGDLTEIDAGNLKTDAERGLVEISAPPPDTTNVYQVVCSYYYIMNEHSLREPFLFADSATITLSATATGNVQAYPVTRNMTDYTFGKTPVLRKANLDPMSLDYYPVFEYYLHPEGYLVFSDNFHLYGDTPAEIEVEYSTLGISPRLSIDLTRSDSTSITPTVDQYQLLLNVRRG